MPQQIVINSDGSLRIVEVGPVGPPGVAGVNGGGGFDNEIENGGGLLFVDNFIFPEDTSIDDLATIPLALPIGASLAVYGTGSHPNFGIWAGTTQPENIMDPELWQPPIRIKNLPDKVLTGVIHAHSTGLIDYTSGLFFSMKNPNGEWLEPIRADRGAGEVPTKSYVVDLRTAETSAVSPLWEGGVPPEDFEPIPMVDDPAHPSTFTDWLYIGVDLSVIPDDVDNLVLLLPVGRWNIVPTAWPAFTRGPWTLSFQFETQDSFNNYVMMGTTETEYLRWGFEPSPIDMTVEFHLTRTVISSTDSGLITEESDLVWAANSYKNWLSFRVLANEIADLNSNLATMSDTLSDVLARIELLETAVADHESRLAALEGA